MKIKGLMGAAAAAMLALGGLGTGAGAAMAPGFTRKGPSPAPVARRARLLTWYRGDGTSKQTNHLSVHTHARENERRRRQMARVAAKR